jgi:hypothetical protein
VGPYHVKKKIVEKPPRNSAGFCGEGQGLSWAVEPRKEEEEEEEEDYLLLSIMCKFRDRVGVKNSEKSIKFGTSEGAWSTKVNLHKETNSKHRLIWTLAELHISTCHCTWGWGQGHHPYVSIP